MFKLSCCIEMLFCEVPFIDRIGAAAKAGFSAVEFWSWENKDLPAIAGALAASGIGAAACCVGTADTLRAKRYAEGAMLRPGNARLYADMAGETMDAMEALGTRTLIATTGQALPGVPREAQRDAISECLRAAAPEAEKRGYTLVLEPLNTHVDHRGYYLESSREALEVLRAVGSPAVKLLYDVYHMQVMEGNLISTVTDHISAIGHIHIADVPGRHEPGTGEIQYANVLSAIARAGYAGFVGCEYSPSAGVSSAEASLAAVRLALQASK